MHRHSQAHLSRNCVTNIWARGLLVFIAVWRLQIFSSARLKIKLELYGARVGSSCWSNLNTIGKQNYQEPGVEAELNFEFFESFHSIF